MSHVDLNSLLADLTAGVPPLPQALCRGNGELFDPHDKDGEDIDDWRYRLSAARRVCAVCPELAACGAWLDTLDPMEKPLGIVAGQLVRRPAWQPKVVAV